MNIIPEGAGSAPSYYCTWEAQNNIHKSGRPQDFARFEGDQGAQLARESMGEGLLFGGEGLARQYDKVRKDLFFVLDDGWDVPYGINPATHRHEFGSLMVNEERFPSCTGTPAQRLEKLNDRVKALGWKGLGLWVASQARGEKAGKTLSQGEAISYWTERIQWCRQAGINYWKVDWGLHCHSLTFRKMLTALGKAHHPALVIEHCRCMLPINEPGRFNHWGTVTEEALRIFHASDAFRSYDVTLPLSAVTTLDRLSVLLNAQTAAQGLVNCEDELYIGAALGCTLGVMRSIFDKAPRKLDEVTRSVRWQRLAPAFGTTGNTRVSNEIGTDSFHYKPGDTWAAELIGKTITQGAPIIIARELALPTLYDTKDVAPFIVASKNPTGAISIATIRRTLGKEGTPLRKIQLDVGNPSHPIGIFGHYQELTLTFDRPITGKNIFAQDLAGDTAREITNAILIENNRLVIPGALITEIGLSNASAGDASEPGLAIVNDKRIR
ncbi:MAG: hypothetical protein FWB88_07395 [Defluviitaleaceae bacterium]|nr:hypothetical protein [Defluviitaleaceae bacterium]MCL2239310.1 hypothetical protein [Defluviitaleaceae bacterium]